MTDSTQGSKPFSELRDALYASSPDSEGRVAAEAEFLGAVHELIEAAKDRLLRPSWGDSEKRLEAAVKAFDDDFRVHPERCRWRPAPHPNPPAGPPAPPVACGQLKGHDGPHRTWRGAVIVDRFGPTSKDRLNGDGS